MDKLPNSSETVYEKVKEGCEELDYAAFLMMDELNAALPEDDLKHDLTSYAESHGINRSKAFMNGMWAWYKTESSTEPAVIEIYMKTGDGSVAILRELGDYLKKYGYGPGDIYWDKIDFLTETEFKMHHMTRYDDGAVAGDVAVLLFIEDKT